MPGSMESETCARSFEELVKGRFPDLDMPQQLKYQIEEIARQNPQAWQNSRYEPYFAIQLLFNGDYFARMRSADYTERDEWLVVSPYVLKRNVDLIPIEE